VHFMVGLGMLVAASSVLTGVKRRHQPDANGTPRGDPLRFTLDMMMTGFVQICSLVEEDTDQKFVDRTSPVNKFTDQSLLHLSLVHQSLESQCIRWDT
jgi:hypothetical protein